MASRKMMFLVAATSSAAAMTYAAYRKELDEAMRRVETVGQIIESSHGMIEFAEAGNGPAVLLSHGAGGGFDQGLDLGRGFVGDHYRVIAPSRFGYLGTPLPADGSPEAQADAYLRLIDALKLDRVTVVGVSAGAPSAMQFCLRHPERCLTLVLIVPMAYAPRRAPVRQLSPAVTAVLNTVMGSDFLFWSATKLARSLLLKTILGTPVEEYEGGTSDERQMVDAILRNILPTSRRVDGLLNDSVVSSRMARYPLEELQLPTLVISAEDDLYGTYENSLYTAGQVPDGKFIGFERGGHLLVGHEAEVRAQIATFFEERVRAGTAKESVVLVD